MTGPDQDLGPEALNRWLAAFAVAYGVLHHQGFLFAGLGTVGSVAGGGTRWADWLDLLTPVVVLGPALGAIRASRPGTPAPWVVFALGALLYVEGHGIHLAANSIANEATAARDDPSPVTHLWDEPLGHHLWGTAVLGLAVSLVLVGWAGHRHRRVGADARADASVPNVVLATFVPPLVLIGGYGVIHGGFPQPSEIGWGVFG